MEKAGERGKCDFLFQDEFHSRLKFMRRGLVAMANGGSNDNGSQFFFTLGRADELNGKHTLFGKASNGLTLSSSLLWLYSWLSYT